MKYRQYFTDVYFVARAKGEFLSNPLTKLRDTLRPKLISGELRLPEAQQKTEADVA